MTFSTVILYVIATLSILNNSRGILANTCKCFILCVFPLLQQWRRTFVE